MKWHQWNSMRLALIAIIIMVTGYIVAGMFAASSFETISKMAYSEENAAAIAANLTHIKSIHSLRQQLLKDRLELRLKEKNPPRDARAWRALLLSEAWLPLLPSEDFVLEPQKKSSKVVWLDRNHLQIPGFVTEFRGGALYDAFQHYQELAHRYELVGEKLRESIIPALIKALSLTLLGDFLILVGIFAWMTWRQKQKVQALIAGFARWSSTDPGFRFTGEWPGELKLIAGYFNNMAKEVEHNREKRSYAEKVASWQIMARKLAHEIKNPLTPIQMIVSELRRSYKGENQSFDKLLTEAHRIITEEVDTLRHLVEHFSHFARLPQPSPTQCDVVSICRHALELEKNAFPQHDMQLLPCDAALAYADPQLLTMVLKNLIRNAAEASGMHPCQIQISIVQEPEQVIIEVQDNGPGITAALLPRIFEPYVTTKHTGPSPGMGLGLAICQKIVVDHGGTLQVMSEPGKTVFTITLPRQMPQEPSA